MVVLKPKKIKLEIICMQKISVVSTRATRKREGVFSIKIAYRPLEVWVSHIKKQTHNKETNFSKIYIGLRKLLFSSLSEIYFNTWRRFLRYYICFSFFSIVLLRLVRITLDMSLRMRMRKVMSFFLMSTVFSYLVCSGFFVDNVLCQGHHYVLQFISTTDK